MSPSAGPEEEPEDGPKYYAVSSGWLRDFLNRLPNPVIAFPPSRLFRVGIQGEGIALPVEGRIEPFRGFHTSRVVAARTAEQAAARAQHAVAEDWDDFGYLEQGGEARLEVTWVEAVGGTWLWRAGRGHTFY